MPSSWLGLFEFVGRSDRFRHFSTPSQGLNAWESAPSNSIPGSIPSRVSGTDPVKLGNKGPAIQFNLAGSDSIPGSAVVISIVVFHFSHQNGSHSQKGVI